MKNSYPHYYTIEPYLQLKNKWQVPCYLGLFPREKTSGTWDSFCPTELEVSKYNHSHHWPQTWQHLNVEEDLQNKVRVVFMLSAILDTYSEVQNNLHQCYLNKQKENSFYELNYSLA